MTVQMRTYRLRLTAVLGCMLAITMVSCKKEGALTATDDNRLYKLPQGNQPFDQQIMQFYGTYKTVILYKFSEADFNYTPNGPIDAGAKAKEAGNANVQQALDFLHQQWLRFYTPEFLQKALPLKILLANDLSYPDRQYRSMNEVKPLIYPAARGGYNGITFGWVDKIATLTPAQIDSARGWLNSEFLGLAMMNKMLELPKSFAALTNYGGTNPYLAQHGIFVYYQSMTVYQDLTDYFRMITTNDYATISSNFLTPAKDPFGKYRAKYDALTTFFKDKYNIDLQAIGNL